MQQVGFVGLGRMGLPMACRLVSAGHHVKGFDVSRDATAAARAQGVQVCSSAAAAVAEAQLVITMLPDPPAVEAAAHGPGGVLEGLGARAVWLEMTSSDPAVTGALSEAAAERSVALVDAPVSGGVLGAREGTLAIACAGPEAAFATARPVLDALGNHIFHVSEQPGHGDLAKTINNLLSAANLMLAAEGLALAMSLGLDPARLIEYVNASTGGSNATQFKVPRYVLSGAFDAGFTLGQYLKDLRIASAVAERQDLDLAIGRHAVELWKELTEAEGPGEDHTVLFRLVAERAGVKFGIGDTLAAGDDASSRGGRGEGGGPPGFEPPASRS
jgi:3-hydroxyisobutyrate dehydrogenase